jgi:hypothetical protein
LVIASTAGRGGTRGEVRPARGWIVKRRGAGESLPLVAVVARMLNRKEQSFGVGRQFRPAKLGSGGAAEE